jgi:hypothetical protein
VQGAKGRAGVQGPDGLNTEYRSGDLQYLDQIGTNTYSETWYFGTNPNGDPLSPLSATPEVSVTSGTLDSVCSVTEATVDYFTVVCVGGESPPLDVYWTAQPGNEFSPT